MPAPCIAKFPPIAEMICLKSIAICILNSFNTQRMKHGKQAIAGGPLQFENDSLAKARKEYRSADQEKAMFCFLDKFNSFNHYSMVVYPVGLHKERIRYCFVLIPILENQLAEVVVLLGAVRVRVARLVNLSKAFILKS